MRGFERARKAVERIIGAAQRPVLTIATASLTLLPAAQAAWARDIQKIGVIVGDLGNPFFEQIAREVTAVAHSRIGPLVEVDVRSSGYDLNRQIRQVETMAAANVDLLIINAVDTDRIGPAVEKARAAGVTVVAVDVKAANAEATIASDNRGAGRLACSYIADRLKGKGSVVILNGPPVSSVVERVEGCRETLATYSEITILPDTEDCGGSIEGGLAHTTDVLTKYPHIDAIFAINDPTAIGADIAAFRAGRTEFFIASIDGSPQGADVLKQQGTRLAATVVQDPQQMTGKAMEIGIALFAGRAIANSDIETPVYLLTVNDVSTYRGRWR